MADGAARPRRVGVIGAGIVGLAIARRLVEAFDRCTLTVLDKEARVAAHQTSHNSGVAHAGLYYQPGSLRATLCRRGVRMLEAYCQERGIPYRRCGKLVIARDAGELGRLAEIERRARANGVPGLRRLGALQLGEIEPHARGLAALHSPTSAVVDFSAVADALAADVRRAGGRIRLSFRVVGIERRAGEVLVRDDRGETLAFDLLLVCAGLCSDRLARAAGDGDDPVIVPFRGEYLRLREERAGLVRGLIYPVPDPAYPFLGVHFTRRIDGSVDIGPNAVLALAREGYRRRDLSPRDVREMLAAGGFRRLARRHWRTGARELAGSLSRRLLVARARSYIPELRAGDVRPGLTGVRAQALDPDGSLVEDFRISRQPGVVIVRNAPSPAATSALAIAEHVVDGLLQRSGV